MNVKAQVSINGPKEAVWDVITDIANSSETISGIDKVEVLEKPENGLCGLRWRETRTLFGKTATEEMWITDVSQNESYTATAESHGFRYISTLTISEFNGHSSLTMTHDSQPQNLLAKVLSPMGFVFKTAIKNAFLRDLRDIKAAVEQY